MARFYVPSDLDCTLWLAQKLLV